MTPTYRSEETFKHVALGEDRDRQRCIYDQRRQAAAISVLWVLGLWSA